MSDPYQIGFVTVTPQAGGYYELSHPSLAEPEKVRGKEKADERALEITAANEPGEGSMEAQIPLDTLLAQAAPVDDAVAALTALVEKQSAMIEKLLAEKATTVQTDGEPAPAPNPFSIMPQEYTGQASDATKQAAAQIGVKYVTIVLEEGPDIPPTGLYIGHNGRGYMISPGEKVDVPDFLLGILDDAIMSSPVVDNKTQKVLGYRQRSKYPYRRV
jgi:hypothetical protein